MILDMTAETFIWLCFVFFALFFGMAIQKGMEESQELILKAENEILREENERLADANKTLREKTNQPDMRHMNEPY